MRLSRLMAGHPVSWFLILCCVFGSSESSAQVADYDHSDPMWFRDGSGQLQPVKSVDDWHKRRADILAGMQAAMGPSPSRDQLVDLDIQIVRETITDELIRREITFAAEPGDRVPAILFLPTPLNAHHNSPAVLALHPTGPLGKQIVAGEGPTANRQYGLELAKRGYVVICPDYPSFGDYTYDFNSDRYESGSMKGIFNHMRCVDVLQSLEMVDAERIAVIGHSLGGHNALFVAAFDPRLKVIVSSCGWTPFADYQNGDLQGWTSDRYMPHLRDRFGLDPHRVPFDFAEVVATLAPRTFFSNSPLHDDNFSVAGVRKAVPQAARVYKLLHASDRLHIHHPPCGHDFPTEIRMAAYRVMDQAFHHTPRSDVEFAGELPRIKPREPQEAIDSFVVQPGFRMELTASEPLVTDPVAMSFDASGNLYVVEMRDYSEQASERLGRIRWLEDTDHDGRFDRSTVFADELSWPTAILCYDDGVFVGAAPDILFLKDTDGDGKADQRETVFTGFGRDNVQGLLNSLRWGIDHRVHGSASSSGGQVRSLRLANHAPIPLRGRDFSFDPRVMDLRPESGGAQHGMCFDDWGRKFVCSNSDHAQLVMLDDRYLVRNPRLRAPVPRVSIAVDGGQAEVFRISPVEPWRIVRTRLRVSGKVPGPIEGGGRAAGYFTSATGITICRGDAYDKDMRGTIVVGDVGSNIIHRKRLVEHGIVWLAERIDENSEFVASTDIWFRPVQFENGPDGCLYALDMYREVIEHPLSLPPEIKRHLDLTSGRDSGRLYRIVPDGYVARAYVDLRTSSSDELVALLGHRNAWHRETTSRLLFERQDMSVLSALEKLVEDGEQPLARVHALYSLRGLSRLTGDRVLIALRDIDPRVREHAVRLSEGHAEDPAIRGRLAELVDDPDGRVRFQLALTSGQFELAWRLPILVKLANAFAGDVWMRTAILSSLADGAGNMFAEILSNPAFLARDENGPFIDELASQVAHANQPDELAMILKAVEAASRVNPDVAGRVIATLGQYNTDLKERIASSSAGTLLAKMIQSARTIVQDETRSEIERSQAAATLALGAFETEGPILLGLIDSHQPAGLQTAALRSLARFDSPEVMDTLIRQWRTLGPAARAESEELIFSRPSRVDRFLKAVDLGTVPLREVPAWRLRTLASSPNIDSSTKALVESISARIDKTPRDEFVRAYEGSLELPGDVNRGRIVFQLHCATCHRVRGDGHDVGPAMESVRNRGKQAILLSVLDPNREVPPQYINYVLHTKEGIAHSGIIAAETANSVTLKQADNKTHVVFRDDIEELVSSGSSIMPEGFEKQIDAQAMADLLEFVLAEP